MPELTQTPDYYLSANDTEQLTDRQVNFIGISTFSVSVVEEELKDRLVAVRRFRSRERPELLGKNLELALGKWKQVASHPNILPFLGLCVDSLSPLPMLVTPRAMWNLLEYVAADPDANKRASVVYSIAAALEYMHGQDPPVTHGNIKGTNVLISGDGIVSLSDIGIHQAFYSPGQVTYDIRWAAPEKVIYNEAHTPACDTWSFAMTVIEMYTSSHPWHYPREETIVTAMYLTELPPRPSVMTDEHLWALLEQCLRYTAPDRPSMESVAKALAHPR